MRLQWKSKVIYKLKYIGQTQSLIRNAAEEERDEIFSNFFLS
jgi:hypothetical protein